MKQQQPNHLKYWLRACLITCYLTLYGSESYAYAHYVSTVIEIGVHVYVWNVILTILLILRISIFYLESPMNSKYHNKLNLVDMLILAPLTVILVINLLATVFPVFNFDIKIIGGILVLMSSIAIAILGNIINQLYSDINGE